MGTPMKSVLVANRGEIAVRIIRTLREMGLRSIAAYSDADADALFVYEADDAYRLGPAPASESYLNVAAILSVCRQAGADAVHPGYGFLSENAAFAEAVRAEGLTFIGPPTDAIRQMGDKVEARKVVSRLGVPLVPGSATPVQSLAEARRIADEIGYPVAIKAAGGGGGRGIRVVHALADLEDNLEGARREADAYFKNSDVYLERYFLNPRHVEIQIVGDTRGTIVHLGERECSVQRRHQKLIEETPSVAVNRELRARMGEAAIQAARSVDYFSAGTVEFLLTEDGDFYFLEMNTRLQVEHPVTEMVSGVDLVREMVVVASGEPLSVSGSMLEPNGHAIEVRINAEDPVNGFRPTPGPVTRYLPPGGPAVRVDSGVYAGYEIPAQYDSLVAKQIAWGPSRDRAIASLLRALQEFRIEGPATTIPFARAILQSQDFQRGTVSTSWLESHLAELLAVSVTEPSPLPGSPQSIDRANQRRFEVEVNGKRFSVSLAGVETPSVTEGKRERAKRVDRSTRPDGNAVVSPMHGTVVTLRKAVGDAVEQGDSVAIVEAMKMENEVPAHRSGTIASLAVKPGDTVEVDQAIATIE